MTKFRDSNKNTPVEAFTYEDVSKIGYEKYVGSDRGNIKIFFYSRGKTGNNKPYMLEGRTFDEFKQFEEMLEKCRADVESLFGSDESISSVNSFGSKSERTPFG